MCQLLSQDPSNGHADGLTAGSPARSEFSVGNVVKSKPSSASPASRAIPGDEALGPPPLSINAFLPSAVTAALRRPGRRLEGRLPDAPSMSEGRASRLE